MNLEIKISDTIATIDLFGAPIVARQKLFPDSSPQADGTLSIYVPDVLRVQDVTGTYRRWFNGTKHFYTVKPTPPTRDK